MSKVGVKVHDDSVSEAATTGSNDKAKVPDEERSGGAGRLELGFVRAAPPRPAKVLGGLGIVAILLVLAGGYYANQNSQDRAENVARRDALQAGSSGIETLLSYDYRDVDEAVNERADLVTGKFAEQYSTLVNKKVAPAAKKARVVTRTEVVSAAVIDADEDQVRLLFFVNQVSAKQGSDVPVLSGSRIRVEMKYVDDAWRVSAVETV